MKGEQMLQVEGTLIRKYKEIPNVETFSGWQGIANGILETLAIESVCIRVI